MGTMGEWPLVGSEPRLNWCGLLHSLIVRGATDDPFSLEIRPSCPRLVSGRGIVCRARRCCAVRRFSPRRHEGHDVVVTAGKPSELAFKLSKFSNIPAGTVTFKVTNEGVAYHNFKICTAPVTNAAKNSCVGKMTKVLMHGQSATLTVKFTKKPASTSTSAPSLGTPRRGMKGLIGIGVKVEGARGHDHQDDHDHYTTTTAQSESVSEGGGSTSWPRRVAFAFCGCGRHPSIEQRSDQKRREDR
jgi:hypothetical protein